MWRHHKQSDKNTVYRLYSSTRSYGTPKGGEDKDKDDCSSSSSIKYTIFNLFISIIIDILILFLILSVRYFCDHMTIRRTQLLLFPVSSFQFWPFGRPTPLFLSCVSRLLIYWFGGSWFAGTYRCAANCASASQFVFRTGRFGTGYGIPYPFCFFVIVKIDCNTKRNIGPCHHYSAGYSAGCCCCCCCLCLCCCSFSSSLHHWMVVPVLPSSSFLSYYSYAVSSFVGTVVAVVLPPRQHHLCTMESWSSLLLKQLKDDHRTIVPYKSFLL